MIKRTIYTAFFLLFTAINSYASTLYISITEGTYKTNLQHEYFIKILNNNTSNDKIIVLDALDGNILAFYDLANYKLYKHLSKNPTKIGEDVQSTYSFRREKDNYQAYLNDSVSPEIDKGNLVRLDMSLLSLEQIINNYKNSFDNIEVAFFGNSHIYQGEKFNFLDSYPSGAFLNLHFDAQINFQDAINNPFHYLSKVDIENNKIRFYVFYDKKHPYEPQLIGFTNALLNKIYGKGLDVFNSRVSIQPLPKYVAVENIHPEKLIAVKESVDSPCEVEDIITPIYDRQVYSVNIKIANPCRSGTLVSFNMKHSSTASSYAKTVELDVNGEGAINFRLLSGQNTISYSSISSKDPVIIFDEEIHGGNDTVITKKRAGHDEVIILGRNMLRQDGDSVKVKSLKTGAVKNIQVINGEYSASFPVSAGLNRFEIQQIDGSNVIKEYILNSHCQDELSYIKSELESSGNLIGTIKNKCRKDGEKALFVYHSGPKDIYPEYNFTFNNGEAKIHIPLFLEVNPVYYKNFDNNIVLWDEFIIPRFDNLVKAVISWKDPVILNLHAFEPNISLTDPVGFKSYGSSKKIGHISTEHPNSYRKNGNGYIIHNLPTEKEITSGGYAGNFSQSYTARFNKDMSNEKFSLYVDHPFRYRNYVDHNQSIILEKLCGPRAQGGLIYNYKVLFNGNIHIGEEFFAPSKCEKKVSAGRTIWESSEHDLEYQLLFSNKR